MNSWWINALKKVQDAPSEELWASLDEQTITLTGSGLEPEDAIAMAILRLGGSPGESPLDGPTSERALDCLLQEALRGIIVRNAIDVSD